MKFHKQFILSVLCGMLAFPALAADGTIHTWTGKGSRHNTTEMEIRSPSLGTAADFIPGTDGSGNLGTASNSWANVNTDDLTVNDDLTVTDALTVNGNVTAGDAATDTFTFTGSTVIIPTTGLYFGTAAANTNIIRLDGTNYRLGVNDTTPDATLDVGGAVMWDGNTTVGDATSDTFTLNPSTITSNTWGILVSTSGDATGNRMGFMTGNNSVLLGIAGDIEGAVTSRFVGELIYNTGTPGEICVSTTAAVNDAWVQVDDAATACSQ